jgi:prenyltransferase beta subunit
VANLKSNKATRALNEALGLIRGPQRVLPLLSRVAGDGVKKKFAVHHLYSYASTKIPSEDTLRSVIHWIIRAQRHDGGIAAYYSLLTGYSDSYPEVTGYIVPTLYDFARATGDPAAARVSEAATRWLLSLQMPSGAFPAGLHRSGASAGDAQPSVFNTGQILQGLVSSHTQTRSAEALQRATAAGDWLVSVQSADGSWLGAGAYQGQAHTY